MNPLTHGRAARATHAFAAILFLASASSASTEISLLNVSYDPTRELYADYNGLFVKHYKEKTGEDVTIEQSHGGSGSQARAVIDGLPADVATLALAYDTNEIVRRTGKIPENWQTLLPSNASPYTSTIVFLVRKGNPKGLEDWDDLFKPGIKIITANPKTSGAARWAYLAAWASVLKKELGSLDKLKDPSQEAAVEQAQAKAREAVTQLYKSVPVLDAGARASTNTFVQRGLGDVLLAWENEAFLAIEELGPDEFEIVTPSISMLAEPGVAVVEANASKHGALEAAQEYLQYLYSPEGQKLIAKHYYRPSKPAFADPKDIARFPKLELVTIDEAFGGWDEASNTHFVDGGVFDQIYLPAAPK